MSDEILEQFDEWASLAKSDPSAFEAKREALIASTIAEAPECHQHRLRQLQWEIDGIRKQSSNPVSAVLKFNNKMMEMLLRQQSLFQEISDLARGQGVTANPSNSTRVKAKVLKIKRKPEATNNNK